MKLSLYFKLTWRLTMMVVVILLLASAAWAQETPPEVWVTTQHNANLRVGPGTNWDVIILLPAGTTLQASGRIFDWVQVIYTPEGETEPMRGWLWRDLLIWTGDINSLPLDGVEPEPFIRVQGYTLTLTPDMIVYHNETFGIGARVTEPLSCTEVEYTGRLGRGDVFWMQFWCNGDYYWVGSHNFFDFEQDEASAFRYYVPVENFNYHYGRMLAQIGNTGFFATNRMNTMRNIWNNLASGQQVSCVNPPREVAQPEIADEDLAAEPDFSAPLAALRTAVDSVNEAVVLFQQTCDHLAQDPFIDPTTVTSAQSHLDEARQYLYLARQFYVPLANRDPYSG